MVVEEWRGARGLGLNALLLTELNDRAIDLRDRRLGIVHRQRSGGADAAEGGVDAHAIDPDIGALWSRIQTEFHANQRVIVESVPASACGRRSRCPAAST